MASHKLNKMFSEHILPRYPLDEAIDWIRANLTPEDVFYSLELIDWALDNGFVKRDEE